MNLSGYISTTGGEYLPGAVVYDTKGNGTSTDADGFYSMETSQGEIITASYLTKVALGTASGSTLNLQIDVSDVMDQVVITAPKMKFNWKAYAGFALLILALVAYHKKWIKF